MSHEAVLEETQTQEQKKTRTSPKEEFKKQPKYQVILWNDDDHSFTYVIVMMKKLFGYTETRGGIIALRVHKCGKATVGVFSLEVAELKRDQIHAFGPDPWLSESKGSMYATIEPLEEI
ncbi:MAG: ATP-dependent Clp protease adaptor ClpS [Planctomycetia bacterium]|nr:ATP-dependent Clp protease adaptor ClpS [Planctomycetia bacterium]